MRYAIFSDVHGDSQALNRVLRDGLARQVDAYLCLGDTGSDSVAQILRSSAIETVFGNWEVSGWRHLAQKHQPWARSLPPMQRYDHFWISHAAPTWPQSIRTLQQFLAQRHTTSFQRLFPYYHNQSDDLWRALAELLEAEMTILFHGHTHRQLIWQLTSDNDLQRKPPSALTLTPGNTYLVGVGSVGQPRDFPKPCYVIFDSATLHVEFLRID